MTPKTRADLPDPDDDRFYQRYVESCRLAGAGLNSGERMRELVSDWNVRFSGARIDSPAR